MTELSLYLHRRDPAQNMARFYTLELQRDLFGALVVLRHWGRIGGRGRSQRSIYPDEPAANKAIAALTRQKIAKGYRAVESCP